MSRMDPDAKRAAWNALKEAAGNGRRRNPGPPKHCSIADCENASRTPNGHLCEKHYYRGRRTGSFEDRQRAGPTMRTHGYLATNQKGHAAASPDGTLYEHRRVFFESYGPDGHTCHWCRTPLLWGGCGAGRLHVDHLDGVKVHNGSDNLVPSCHRCNVNRGLFTRWLQQHRHDPLLREFFVEAARRVA